MVCTKNSNKHLHMYDLCSIKAMVHTHKTLPPQENVVLQSLTVDKYY